MHHPLKISVVVETKNYKAGPMFDEEMKEIPPTDEIDVMQKKMEETKSHFVTHLEIDGLKNQALSRLFDNADLKDQCNALESVLDYSDDLIAKKLLGD